MVSRAGWNVKDEAEARPVLAAPYSVASSLGRVEGLRVTGSYRAGLAGFGSANLWSDCSGWPLKPVI